jgi:hypothetical protein
MVPEKTCDGILRLLGLSKTRAHDYEARHVAVNEPNLLRYTACESERQFGLTEAARYDRNQQNALASNFVYQHLP